MTKNHKELPGNFLWFFVICWLFQNYFFSKNSFRNNIRVSNSLGGRAWSGSKLFAKMISRRQNSLLAGKELSNKKFPVLGVFLFVFRGGPSPCMPYKLQIWYSDRYLEHFLTSFVHLSCILMAIMRQLYTTMKSPFSLQFISFPVFDRGTW